MDHLFIFAWFVWRLHRCKARTRPRPLVKGRPNKGGWWREKLIRFSRPLDSNTVKWKFEECFVVINNKWKWINEQGTISILNLTDIPLRSSSFVPYLPHQMERKKERNYYLFFFVFLFFISLLFVEILCLFLLLLVCNDSAWRMHSRCYSGAIGVATSLYCLDEAVYRAASTKCSIPLFFFLVDRQSEISFASRYSDVNNRIQDTFEVSSLLSLASNVVYSPCTHTRARVCVPRPIYFLFFNIVVIHIFFFLFDYYLGRTNKSGRARQSKSDRRAPFLYAILLFLSFLFRHTICEAPLPITLQEIK